MIKKYFNNGQIRCIGYILNMYPINLKNNFYFKRNSELENTHTFTLSVT